LKADCRWSMTCCDPELQNVIVTGPDDEDPPDELQDIMVAVRPSTATPAPTRRRSDLELGTRTSEDPVHDLFGQYVTSRT